MMSFTAAYLLRLAAWGLLFAALLGGPIRVSWRWWDRALAGASADLRHRLVCGHFFALLILPGAAVGSVHLALAGMGTEISREPAGAWTGFIGDGRSAGWLTLLIVAAWFLGVTLAVARLAADAWQLCGPCHEPAPAPLTDEVHRLRQRVPGGGRLTVHIADVPVPRVVGIVRPVLIVPAGLDGLPVAEREAVWLHELTHVARRDFAANLVQRLALAALWFQPVAGAMYRRIYREREARCDRMAVNHGASAPALARALVRLAKNPLSPPVALAVTGHGDLCWRVNRLATPERAVRLPHGWIAALLGILALGLFGLGGTRLAAADGAMTDLYIASAAGPVVSVCARDPGGAFGLRIRRGHVLEASVEHRSLPTANIRQQGDHVTLLGAENEPVVTLRVTPAGRIEWRARLARTPGS